MPRGREDREVQPAITWEQFQRRQERFVSYVTDPELRDSFPQPSSASFFLCLMSVIDHHISFMERRFQPISNNEGEEFRRPAAQVIDEAIEAVTEVIDRIRQNFGETKAEYPNVDVRGVDIKATFIDSDDAFSEFVESNKSIMGKLAARYRRHEQTPVVVKSTDFIMQEILRFYQAMQHEVSEVGDGDRGIWVIQKMKSLQLIIDGTARAAHIYRLAEIYPERDLQPMSLSIFSDAPEPMATPAGAKKAVPKTTRTRRAGMMEINLLPHHKKPRKKPSRVRSALIKGGVILAGAAATTAVVHEGTQRLFPEQEEVAPNFEIPDEAKPWVMGVALTSEQEYEAVPGSNFESQAGGRFFMVNGKKIAFSQPDGSWLTLPSTALATDAQDDLRLTITESPRNVASTLPYRADSVRGWQSLRYPVEALRNLGAYPGEDGLWHPWLDDDKSNDDIVAYAVLKGGHLLKIIQLENETNYAFSAYGSNSWGSLSELSNYYKPVVDVSQIDAKVPKGFVDVAKEPKLKDVKCELSYRTYNNTIAGVPLYPENYPCMIPKKEVDALANVVSQLRDKGYRLQIEDAKRPPSVQRALFNIVKAEFEKKSKKMPSGYVANPDGNPPHYRGALDVKLLDANYDELYPSSFDSFDFDNPEANKVVGSPTSWDQAKAWDWERGEYDSWKIMHDIFIANGFVFNPKERWHVEYKGD